ncbi:hypothetical protein DFJ74DRAFT_664192 [Hyaloraphidium curvatum]|nr:hypothetical protein DFJ74DRAFT_664192 [Hyaloraphidium curvatum]
MAAWKVAKVVSMMPLPALIFIANKLGGNANYGVTPKLGHPLMSISIAQTSWKVFGIVMPAILGQLGAGNLKKPMEAVSAVGHLVLDSVGLPYLIDAPPDVLGPENKKWSKVQVTGNFIAQRGSPCMARSECVLC